VTLVVPYPAGGSLDVVARILAKRLSWHVGHAFVVENKGGAGTIVGTGAVARAKPDGCTLLLSSNTTFTINPALRVDLPYDPLASFEAIGLVGGSPLVLLAHPRLPVRSVRDVVALARSRPGQLTYASFGIATTSHLAGEMFKAMAGIDITHVPCKGGASAMMDLISGEVNFSFDVTVAALPQIACRRVRAVAITSKSASPSIPGVPTIAQAGYPEYEMVPWLALVGPKGLPSGARTVLVEALEATLADDATRGDLHGAGLDVAYGSPQDYVTRVAAELPRERSLVKRMGIKVD
jgi:tripartite-type tricarboxylate transporter receptor subunit TctC